MRERRTLSTDSWKAAVFLGFFLLFPGLARAADLAYDFSAAKEAYAEGDAAALAQYSRKLKGTPLEPYADFWRLGMNLQDNEAVEAFLDKHEGSLLAESLRKEWLKSVAKSGDWQTFYVQYPEVVNPDTELVCDWIQARKSLGQKDAIDDALPLWPTPKERPKSCEPLFGALMDDGSIAEKDVWARIRMILDSGDITLARKINRFLPDDRAMKEKSLLSAYENPYRYLKRENPPHSRAQKEIAIFAVTRIARADPVEARTFWSNIESRFDEGDRNYVQGKIAFQAALKHMPEAIQWFNSAGKLDDAELAWKARAALRVGDWAAVSSSIASMSADQQNGETWRYWKARSLKEQGKLPEANAILADLSHRRDYYGQLALDELGTVFTLPPDAYKATDPEIEEVKHSPGIERSLLLYSLGLRFDATREWIWAIRGFDDKQLLAAAELAKRRGLYDRAINTAEKTVKLYDFDLRFLAPYRDIMHEQTVQLGLDEAWVYGLIRQESRFVTGAKSGTGASGLMQLMPATARWVASKMGLRNFRHALVNQIETNISLGTYYLKHVLTVLDNQPVLASAAYNAGPSKARQWIGPAPMEGAIYIETIPYGETRDYVKKVMSNTEYYATVFGQGSASLKDRLGVIGKVSYGNDP